MMSGQEKKGDNPYENGDLSHSESSDLSYLANPNVPEDPSNQYGEDTNKRKSKDWP
jgi:hypothetical protein